MELLIPTDKDDYSLWDMNFNANIVQFHSSSSPVSVRLWKGLASQRLDTSLELGLLAVLLLNAGDHEAA